MKATSDALLAAGAFVVSWQQIVSRNVDPTMSAVVTVGTIHAGASPDGIPEEATVTGTIHWMTSPRTDSLLS
ncbi:hypothetical protein [Arthrobacter globiformis]|uniref:hypothetical protein n=1 Tax=Arthrobacter globiformis TaxID=1665 RepID=UPI0027D85E8E|nr:hypothetical protein [Arthrobacter globiformis]